MNKNERILLFLGRIQARIEDLGKWAAENDNTVFEFITDLEQYFNQSLDDIFSDDDEDEEEDELPRRGLTWTTLR